MNSVSSPAPADLGVLARRHLRFAWWSLLCFLSLGILLEAMHALKVEWYLKPAYETRRLMWTLGHAHGTLLALVHAAFATWIQVFVQDLYRVHRWASICLIGGGLLLPGGFFLGGVFLYAGDPGLGIFLVPVGAGCLLVGVLLTALAVSSGSAPLVRPEQSVSPSKRQVSRR